MMIAAGTPTLPYAMESRSLIGLLFTRNRSSKSIRTAYRRTVRRLRRLPLDAELRDSAHRRLRRIIRRVCDGKLPPKLRERSAAKVIRLTVNVLAKCSVTIDSQLA